METREQTLAKMEFYKETLSDEQLRLAVAFMKGLSKSG